MTNRPIDCRFQGSSVGDVVNAVDDFTLPFGLYYGFNSTNGSAAASYDELVDQVWPILTVILPPANVSREAEIGYSQGTMTCLRAGRNVKAGSRVPVALPAAQPVHFPSHLSKGAIAGIVVGSVVGAVILMGAIWWGWTRHRKRSVLSDEKDAHVVEVSSPQENGNSVPQLDSKGASAQLEGVSRAELRGVDGGLELPGGTAPPQELEGHDFASPAGTRKS